MAHYFITAYLLPLYSFPLCITAPNPIYQRTSLIRKSRIVGGSDAKSSAWPWMVGLINRNQPRYRRTCGGVLIARNLILSAGHCFLEYDLDEIIWIWNLHWPSLKHYAGRLDRRRRRPWYWTGGTVWTSYTNRWNPNAWEIPSSIRRSLRGINIAEWYSATGITRPSRVFPPNFCGGFTSWKWSS